jgi:hypothetical protein
MIPRMRNVEDLLYGSSWMRLDRDGRSLVALLIGMTWFPPVATICAANHPPRMTAA